MIHIRKALFAVFSTNNPKRLAATSYNKLIPNALRPFPIVIVEPNTLALDIRGIHNTVWTDRAKLVLRQDSPSKAYQSLPIKKEQLTESCSSM